MSKSFSSTLAAMAAAGLLLSSPVFATPTDSNTSPSVQSEVQEEWMSLRQAYEALEKAGYKDSEILSLMRSRFGYIAHVLDGEEKRVRLLINPTTGDITKESMHRGGGHHRHFEYRRGNGSAPFYRGGRSQGEFEID